MFGNTTVISAVFWRLRPCFLPLVLVVMLCGPSGMLRAQTPGLKAEQFKNLGVAYLEESRFGEAERAFRRVIDLASNEPLGYANLGIVQLRLGRLEPAASQLEQARRVDPANIDVLLLGAEVQYSAGHWEAVLRTANRVLTLEPGNSMARYYICRAARAQREDPQMQRLAAQQMVQLYREHPENLVVAIRYARLQAENAAWTKVASALDLLEGATRDVDPARQAIESARKALADPVDAEPEDADTKGAGAKERAIRYQLAVLENVMRPTPRFRQDLFQLQPPVAGLPIERFSDTFYTRLQRERPRAVAVQFVYVADASVPSSGAPQRNDVSRASLDFGDIDGDGRDEWLVSCVAGDQGTVELWQSQRGVWRNLLADHSLPATSQARLVDLNDDGRFEIAAVGPTGTMLLQQEADDRWEDVLAAKQMKPLPGNAIELMDADNEGDLDLCVGGVEQFAMWQNSGGDSLLDISTRSGLAGIGGGVEQIVATDHDDDLDTDLIVVDADGQLQLWDNQRHGRFARLECGLSDTATRFVLSRDWDNDGYEDLLTLSQAGRIAVQRNQQGTYAPAVELPLDGVTVTALTQLDFDNDGWIDVAVAGQQAGKGTMLVLRNQGDGTWTPTVLPSPADSCVALGAVDYDRDGDLDLAALDGRGQLRTWRNDGGNANHWLRVELKGLRIAGSKNNLHGLGSKLEVKAGLHYAMRSVRRPITHFGLGTRPRADLLRVMWSNGVPQNHIQPIANQTVREVQVLKSSCPYLYCWDGTKFVFVTDTLAGAPLGLQVAAGVVAPDNPRELLTVPRDKIARKDDSYIFQYTSELWETAYLDEVALWAVDHPAGSDVFTDQRFLPPPYGAPEPVVTQRRVIPRRVEDTNGRDVTAQLLKFDHQYPEQLRPTRYQGIVQPHCLTMHFGDVSELVEPLLMLRCWIFWTDTSINVAMSQDPNCTPQPTVLEVGDPDAGWQAVDEPFGLPNGKDKWVMLDVAKYLDHKDARIRLRSESQIHWDQAFLADRATTLPRQITKLRPTRADLHFGGFNELYRPGANGPHLYRYGKKIHSPVWMDMSGMATRYGDVSDLLLSADDLFVIFTGGDEVTLHFDATELPELPAGWQRDFLFYSDGWEKDSDRNTITGETVEPLPYHGMSAYPYPSHEKYPQDERHQDYQRQYNTRRIGPSAFRDFVKEYRGNVPPQLPWDREPLVRPSVRGDQPK